MKTMVKTGGIIVLSGLLLAGCGNQAKASTPKTTGQPQLTRLTKQVKSLYADSKYEMPAKQLSEAALTKANTQRDKVYKLRGDLSKAQQKTFKVDQQQLQAAKKIFSVQDTLNVALDKDQVLKDESFKIQAFNNDFTYLQAHKAKFAATIRDKATLLDREVKAVALVKAATTGDPDQTKIDQARDAINAVNVQAFKNKYLPKLDEAIKKLPKDQQADQAKKQSAAGDSQLAAVTQPAASSSQASTASSHPATTAAASGNTNASTSQGQASGNGGSGNSGSGNAQPSTSKVLGVSFISQEAAGAPEGCEAASALEALHYKGHASGMSLASFLRTMPIAANGNPYQGFGGTPYAVVDGVYQSIFPSAFTPWVAGFGGASNISGSSLDGIISQIAAGNPVVAWVTLNYQGPQWHHYDWGNGIDNAHVVTVDGYNGDSMHIVDPENGTYWISKGAFNAAYSYMKFAVAIS
ncbi:putative membrane protein [Lacticaseibacillus paracasei subsp. paracasei Lpp22]|uniref:Putative membrane protein n=1 Tax=Lacticaseibacillus paracasei subsp. paracasei Lpp22 TaxID=1256221 RepID=A0A8E0I8C9_LACPA|nr:putative membrane protein [Lacticaseibacillus paracasei subsp. paracasei Lpp22]